MFNTLDISTSGLIAQRQRMNTIAGNIANVNTTRNEKGELSPYQRRMVTFSAQTESQTSNKVTGVNYRVEADRSSEPRKIYDPAHPDAADDGYVSFPSIDTIIEFVNAMEASRAYEANISAIEITKQMAQQTLRVLA